MVLAPLLIPLRTKVTFGLEKEKENEQIRGNVILITINKPYIVESCHTINFAIKKGATDQQIHIALSDCYEIALITISNENIFFSYCITGSTSAPHMNNI